MIKPLISFLFVVVFCSSVYAQETNTVTTNPKNTSTKIKEFNTLKDRLYFGGNIGGMFGTISYINLSPLIGIKITKDFSVGGGFTYNYYSQTYQGKKYSSTIYGGNAFARYIVLENLFAQIGWDRLSVPDYNSPIYNSRAWIDNILIGGGYKQAFSANGNFVAAIFYNINETPLSPYPNPIIQIGFNFGF